MSFNIIKNINKENFLFGGLAYHHKEVTDLDERNKEFEDMKKMLIGSGELSTGSTSNNLYIEMQMIKSSQSLTRKATEEFSNIMNRNDEAHPLDKVYLSNKDEGESDNTFIRNGVEILDSDMVILLPYVGVVGDTYNYPVEEHTQHIVYEYSDELEIYIGKVMDGKIMDDLLNYKHKIKEGIL